MITTIEPKRLTPGIYRDMPAEEYHAIDACSASRLIDLMRSPAHCRWRMLNHETTPAMELGTALHCAVLEPEIFSDHYVVAPNVDARTKAGKAERDAFIESLGDSRAIKSDDMGRVLAMRDSIMAHPAARKAIQASTDRELSVMWELDGLACKSRIDLVSSGLCFDVKTTTDASTESFTWSIMRRGYYVQAAFYLNALDQHGFAAGDFAFIAVESEPPFAVNVIALDDEDLSFAHAQMTGLVAQYAALHGSGWNVHPCYGSTIKIAKLPRMREAQIIEQ